jgi:hypothetical protein
MRGSLSWLVGCVARGRLVKQWSKMGTGRIAAVGMCLAMCALPRTPEASAAGGRPAHVLVVTVYADSGDFRLVDPIGRESRMTVDSSASAVPTGWHVYADRQSAHDSSEIDEETHDDSVVVTPPPDGQVIWIVENPVAGVWRLEATAMGGGLDSILVHAEVHGDAVPDLAAGADVLLGLRPGEVATWRIPLAYGTSRTGQEWGRVALTSRRGRRY